MQKVLWVRIQLVPMKAYAKNCIAPRGHLLGTTVLKDALKASYQSLVEDIAQLARVSGRRVREALRLRCSSSQSAEKPLARRALLSILSDPASANTLQLM